MNAKYCLWNLFSSSGQSIQKRMWLLKKYLITKSYFAIFSIVFIVTFLTSITCWLPLNLPYLANTVLLRKKGKKAFPKNTEPTQNAHSNKDWVQMLLTLSLAKWTMESCKVVNKHLLDEVEHDIMNYQNRGLCYLPQPSASADNTDTRFW